MKRPRQIFLFLSLLFFLSYVIVLPPLHFAREIFVCTNITIEKNSHSNKSAKKSDCMVVFALCFGVFKLCMFSFACHLFFYIWALFWRLGTPNKQTNKRFPSQIFLSFFSHCNNIYRTIRLEKPFSFVIQITM